MSKWPYNTSAWQHLRRAKLSDQPLCEACLRREVIEVADTVDHIVAIEKGGDPFPPLDQLMSMCASCHNIKTNAVDHPSATGLRRAYKGCDANGDPIDPDGWDAPSTPARPAVAPGGFASSGSTSAGPACETRVDLLSCESFATSKQEASKWA